MPFVVESRRKSLAKIQANHPGAIVLDVTSKGPQPWVKFSPFFPHGGIPIPNTPGRTALSVEGIWQGLKVFENANVDTSKMSNCTMTGLKRTQRRFGHVKGHQFGLISQQLLPYIVARKAIYLPSYRWVLEHKLESEMETLRQIAADKLVVLLDYETNPDWQDPRRPLSHAALIQQFLERRWPVETTLLESFCFSSTYDLQSPERSVAG